MKKTTLIHSALSGLIARLGHTDTIVIGDMGLPVPDGVPCIDLALTKNEPRFKIVLNVILTEMYVEKYIIAKESSKEFAQLCQDSLQKAQITAPAMQLISHEKLKELSGQAKAIIRTGECQPYHNIILSSGVTF